MGTKSSARGQNWMPIGRFSNACRLSIKALRHYDEQGMLKPAYVDPDTGYRYYRPEQARDAVLIAMLRSLDIPLPAIGRLLHADKEERRRLLDQERERIERVLARQRHAMRSIERIARAGELLPYEIALRIEPTYRVARLSIMTSPERMLDDSGKLVYRLFDALRATGTEPGDPVMCINEDADADGNIRVHACAGVDAAVVGAGDRFEVVDIPGGPVCWLTHRGAYEELGLAYHALSAWAQARGHEQRDALREIYRNDPAHTPAEELITEVLLPIRA
ncbi:MAG: MerR family transcriptional regulator [Gammaproteobacteria bacterium]